MAPSATADAAPCPAASRVGGRLVVDLSPGALAQFHPSVLFRSGCFLKPLLSARTLRREPILGYLQPPLYGKHC